MINNIYCPISIFSLEDYGIESNKFLEHMRPFFYKFEWDIYLLKQKQIDFILNHLPQNAIFQNVHSILSDYYEGYVGQSILDQFLVLLSEPRRYEFENIYPTRRRAMLGFKVIRSAEGVHITQKSDNSFLQDEALKNDKQQDWRKIKRQFNSPPPDLITDDLLLLLEGISLKIFHTHPDVHGMSMFLHFTQIVAYPEVQASNSPEGIHQDGMDYIVSALVVERNNIKGGKSIIYNGKDPNNELMSVVLQDGYGLFQPDKGTDLWHYVEPVSVHDSSHLGYRSTIGIDFSFDKEKIPAGIIY